MTEDEEREFEQEQEREYIFHFFFVHGLLNQLFHIEDFIISTDKFLKDKYKNAEELPDENPDFTEEYQFGEMFPQILWKSTFLHLYSIFEDANDEICNNLSNFLCLNPKYKSRKKVRTTSTVQHQVNFLINDVKLDLSAISTKIEKLRAFSLIRNALAHSDGFISAHKSKTILNLLNDIKKMLDIKDDGTCQVIFLNKEFVLVAHKLIWEYFEEVQLRMNEIKHVR